MGNSIAGKNLSSLFGRSSGIIEGLDRFYSFAVVGDMGRGVEKGKDFCPGIERN